MAYDLLVCRMADSPREQCTRTVVQAGKFQEGSLGLRNQIRKCRAQPHL